MSDENITVGSAHVDLGPHFREQAQQQIRAATKKHLGDLTMASVHVAQEGTYYREPPVRAALRRKVLGAENSAYGQPYALCLREA